MEQIRYSSRIFLLVTIFAVFGCVPTDESVQFAGSPSTIHIPEYFYGDRIGSCQMTQRGQTITLDHDFVEQKIASVIGFDWDAYHRRRGTSKSVHHEVISVPARYLSAAAKDAVDSGDPGKIRKAVSLHIKIAQAETLLDTMTVSEVERLGTSCYDGVGNTSAPCHGHAPQFAANFGSSYLVSAILLKSEMSASQREVVDAYARQLHRRYIKPWATNARIGPGFYQYANAGIGELAYAAWIEDERLAVTAFKRTFRDIDKKFFADGYIDNNSFRGVRGFWYHTYGVNSALAMIGLAEAWHVPVPPRVRDKVVASTRLINVGVRDLEKFYDRPFSGYRGNALTDPRDAIPRIHESAIAIDTMAERYANVILERDPAYLDVRRYEGPSDFTVGFHPGCMIEQ